MLISISGWQALFWAALIPLFVRIYSPSCSFFFFRLRGKAILYQCICLYIYILFLNDFQIILAVGTKLQAILTKMALEIIERHAVVQGIPLVQGSDKYFWFGRPHLMLNLIHFALFQVLNVLCCENKPEVISGL